MPIPSVLVSRYFQLLVYRQFTEAERELERLKQKMHKTEWNRGYFRALYGMMLARKSNNNDSYAFFSKLDLNDKTALNNYKREFSEHMKNGLHGDFDRGFFSAWNDCMRVLHRLDLSNVPNAAASTAIEKQNAETVQEGKSQVTIQDFFGEEE
jgi:hypothetical protein